MAKDKRTEDEIAFDWNLHGISFCDAEMLARRVAQAEAIATRLPNDAKRQARLAFWQAKRDEQGMKP